MQDIAFDDPMNLALGWIGARACFVAGTQVIVGVAADGTYLTKAIEDLRVGDLVLARGQHSETDDIELRPVARVFEKTSDHLRVITIRDGDGQEEVIQTTDEHPFWVRGRGWVRAADLKPGDRVNEADESNDAVIVSTARESHAEGIKVYNFEVESDHTYFVADGFGQVNVAVWVHNLCFLHSIQDKLGRIGQVISYVTPADVKRGGQAVTYGGKKALQAVRAVGDDAGHLIAKRLAGSGGAENLVAQLRSINRGAFRVFEGEIAKRIEKVGDAIIHVIPKYIGNSKRPSAIEYFVQFKDGVQRKEIFKNI